MIEQKIKTKFNQVNKAFFEKEAGNTFLRIELNLKDLNEITKISKEISIFLDSEKIEEDQYFLDVYSSGTDQVIDINNLENYIGQNILITVIDKIKDKESFEGELISEKPIVIKWNNKGQLKKEEIDIKNIKEIKLYAKAGKK